MLDKKHALALQRIIQPHPSPCPSGTERPDLVPEDREVILRTLLCVRVGHEAVIPQASDPLPGALTSHIRRAATLHPDGQESRVEIFKYNLLQLE